MPKLPQAQLTSSRVGRPTPPSPPPSFHALQWNSLQCTLHCNSLVLCDLGRRLMRLARDGLVWRDWKMESRHPAFNWIELKNWRPGYFGILSDARRGGVIIKKSGTQWDHITSSTFSMIVSCIIFSRLQIMYHLKLLKQQNQVKCILMYFDQ